MRGGFVREYFDSISFISDLFLFLRFIMHFVTDLMGICAEGGLIGNWCLNWREFKPVLFSLKRVLSCHYLYFSFLCLTFLVA